LPKAKTDHLKIEDMAYVVSTGYGRVVVPFADRAITEITCHCRGAQWFVPGVSTVLDVGGQDSKGIRLGAKGEVADFVMNDKCAGGTGRFMEIVAEVLQVPLSEIGPLALESTKVLPFSTAQPSAGARRSRCASRGSARRTFWPGSTRRSPSVFWHWSGGSGLRTSS
jgi:predicted CoA-substrate-specific enzyme activase